MSEVKNPEKPKHSMFCPQISAKHIRCACDQKELIELYDDFEAYHDQELAKEKAKRVRIVEELESKFKAYRSRIEDDVAHGGYVNQAVMFTQVFTGLQGIIEEFKR